MEEHRAPAAAIDNPAFHRRQVCTVTRKRYYEFQEALALIPGLSSEALPCVMTAFRKTFNYDPRPMPRQLPAASKAASTAAFRGPCLFENTLFDCGSDDE